MAVIFVILSLARVFASVSHFHTSLVFAGKTGAYQSGAPEGIQPNGWLPALPPNIRLGGKWLTFSNTQAYCHTAKITAVKCFIIQAPVIDLINMLHA